MPGTWIGKPPKPDGLHTGRLEPESPPALQPPVEFTNGYLMSLSVWFAIKAILGIVFVVGLTHLLGGSIWLGVTVGSGLSFVLANGQR